MMDDDPHGRRSGGTVEVIASGPSTSQEISVGLGAIITNFGASRAIRSVRRTIEEKAAMVAAERRLGEELLTLEIQKEKWRSLETIRQTVREEIEAKLMEAQLRKKRVAVALIDGDIDQKRAEKRRADVALLEQIEADLIRTRSYEVKADARDAQKRYDGRVDDDKRGWSAAKFSELKREYEELMALKAEDLAKYGSEDAFPEFLRAAYAKAEDSLGFRETT
jgi:hypothetical protein